MAGSAPFYQAFVEIVPEAKGFSKKLSDEFGTAGPEAGKRAGAGISGGILASIGLLAAPIAAAFAGIGIGSIIKDSITQASDLNEAATAIGEVFGDQAQAIQDFAKAGATAFGETNINVLRAAQNFGIYGKAAGLAGKDLTEFSTELVGLGTDLASFFNTDTQTAMDAISAGLRGESEPLRQFGVLLDDATLRSRAMTLGIYDGTGALTQQQRVLAAQAEILAQTTTAQGDFARTSGGLANQQRILAASYADLKTSLGALLLPAATALVTYMNSSVIPTFQKLLPAVQGVANILFSGNFNSSFFDGFNIQEDSALVDVLFTIRESLQSLAGFVTSTFGPVFDALGPTISDLLPQFVDLWASVSPLALSFKALAPVIPQIAEALGGALNEAITALVPVLPVIGDAFTQIVSAIVPLLPQILSLVPVLLQLVPPLTDLLVTLLPPLVDMLAELLPQSIDQLSFALQYVLIPVAEFLIQNLSAILGVASALSSFFQGDIGPQEYINKMESLGGTLGFFINVIGDTIRAITNFAAQTGIALRQFVDAISAGIAEAVMFLQALPSRAAAAVGDLGSLFFSSGRSLINGFVDGILSAIGSVGSAMGSVMDFAASFLPHSPAERGQFAGSGWAAVKSAGVAVGSYFGEGLTASTASLGLAPVSLTSGVTVPRAGSIDMERLSVGGGSPVALQNVTEILRFQLDGKTLFENQRNYIRAGQ